MSIESLSGDRFIDQIKQAMDVISRRQQLVASNVGNIDTPGYRAVDMDFDKALQEATGTEASLPMLHGSARHLDGGTAADLGSLAHEVEGLAMRPDGNNVSLDREMMNLAATKHRYEVSASLVRQRIRLMRYAIGEGRSS